uniref:C-mannosyltransferase DPY19L1 n=1 Tax=Ditylenchus dipsaci TaxID=166011 RepID=A0A915DMX4_9BILA
MGSKHKKKELFTLNNITKSKISLALCSWYFLVVSTCIALWVIHSIYLRTLFENVLFFSHLADFEREMAYRTEMGLYFSYYKTLITSPTFANGLYLIMNDNVTEYGNTINTLQRFNLYPEVILAVGYKLLKSVCSALDWQAENFVKVLETCIILHIFCVGLAGSVVPSLFLIGLFLSGSYFGGLLSAAAFFFNHGEATRVQWTPPLRESFAYPVFIAQMAMLTYMLKSKSCNRLLFWCLTLLTTLFILFWQFSQFALATQLGSFAFIRQRYVAEFIIFTSLIAILVIYMSQRLFAKITFRPLFIALHIIIYLALVFGMKVLVARILNIRDDDHVGDILRSKFTDFATFHTRLYTCAQEFDFLGYEAIHKLTTTWLLPSGLFACLSLAVYLIRNDFSNRKWLWRKSTNSDKSFSEIVYNAVQLACFVLMAVLIMRLKLFSTPHLCALASLVANKEFMQKALHPLVGKLRLVLVFALLAAMSFNGYKNVKEEMDMRGEFSNPEQEYLFEWILKQTKPTSVFAGSMAVMANVKLSTLRPIVNHPQYENEDVRERTLKVYSIYSRKPLDAVHKGLRDMHIDYYIFQQSSCAESHPNPLCTYKAMWDLQDPSNRHNEPLCNRFMQAIKTGDQSLIHPMQIVYISPGSSYAIFKL